MIPNIDRNKENFTLPSGLVQMLATLSTEAIERGTMKPLAPSSSLALLGHNYFANRQPMKIRYFVSRGPWEIDD